MIFRKQLGPKDCFRTVIGCVTDTEPQDVPDFMASDDSDFCTLETYNAIRDYLRVYNFDILQINVKVPDDLPVQDILDHIEYLQGSDIVYLLCGMSVAGHHVVICRGNKIIWDPSPVNAWIRGPYKGLYCVNYISKSFMRYNGPLPENQNPFDIGADDNEDQISV